MYCPLSTECPKNNTIRNHIQVYSGRVCVCVTSRLIIIHRLSEELNHIVYKFQWFHISWSDTIHTWTAYEFISVHRKRLIWVIVYIEIYMRETMFKIAYDSQYEFKLFTNLQYATFLYDFVYLWHTFDEHKPKTVKYRKYVAYKCMRKHCKRSSQSFRWKSQSIGWGFSKRETSTTKKTLGYFRFLFAYRSAHAAIRPLFCVSFWLACISLEI